MNQWDNLFKEVTCAKCGKRFIPARFHVFKHGSKYYCKWTCFNHRDDKGASDCKK